MKPRSQLEAEVIAKCKKLAKILNISEDEAEKRAKQLLPANSDKDLRDFLSQPLKKLTLNFLDPGHRAADKKIAQMDKEVSKVYSRASEEMSQKLEKYLDRFREADERMKKNVADGLMSEDDYKTWRKGQLMQAERWTHMRDELAADASNSVDIARSVVQGHMPEVYAENFNYGTYEIEHGTRMNTSFTLYDRQTVERLLRDNPKLLPDPSKGSKTAVKIAKNKDLRWNRNHIQGELLQGILQGESIPDIAKRMRNVEKMNKRASMNYARTMTTGAENAGRIDSYKRAQDMGIDVGPAWMATLDGRTRDSHRHLDGERRNEKTGKFSNGCRYPGDPQGSPGEVYNCRCTLVAQIKGFESDFSDMSWRRHDQLGKMSYDEWRNEKSKKKPAAISKDDKVLKGYKKLTKSYSISDNIKATNPHYSPDDPEYARNCQRCVVTFEARCRGYDVTAGKRVLDGTDRLPIMNDPNGWPAAFEGGHEALIHCDTKDPKRDIDKMMEEFGTGSRAIVRVRWKNFGGHVFIAVNDDGIVKYYDPQNGSYKGTSWARQIKKDKTYLLRTDDKAFTNLAKKCFE